MHSRPRKTPEGQHAEAFAKNGIADDVLRDLTDADLKEFGLNLGDRKRLLKAIAALDAGLAQHRGEAAEPAAAPPVPREAERRQLTVLFCDLVGSTELSARLDPEDMRNVIGAYQASVAEVVRRWEGHVANYMGDGVLAYFGWPRAHEDDAERAARAGLELIEVVGRLEADPDVRLQARVGIATGHVVVGDLLGQDTADRDSVVGETPNLAARLQALARPGAVVISPATRKLIGGLFELDDLGPQRLKGFAEPLAVWRVAGEGRAEGRFEARQTAALTPLVGRDEEISLVLRRWGQAKDGEGQVVLLSGEPGIGKSRLVRELRARLADVPHIRLLYQCSPHHQTSPLHPIIEQLERAAGFERDDTLVDKLDRLERLLAQGTGKLAEAVPLIAAVLGVPAGDRYPLPELAPQRQKQRTLEALVDQLDGLSAGQPVLVTYEDVHWIDPTTQELLGLAIERVQRLPVLTIITFRPEFASPWTGLPHVSGLSLTRLGRRDGAALVERVVREKRLPAEVSAEIVAKTDGVPLFVEELTKTVLESGLLVDAGDHYELSGPLPPLAIPSTLHDSLLARLDRSAPVKEIAQIGAAIGRDFSHALLAAVAEQPEDQLQSALDQLISSELVFRRGAPPEATYSFKHALVQDAAYGTLLKSRRQQLHMRIVEVLEGQSTETAQAQPELLAHHCTEAGLIERAVDYWHQAGQQALARSAAIEALAQLNKGIELLRSLPDGRERRRRELDLQVAVGGAVTLARGWASPEMGRAYARARDLSRELGDSRHLLLALHGLVLCHVNRAELDAGYQAANELVRLAQTEGDVTAELMGHRIAGVSLMFLARFDSASAHFEQAIARYDPLKHWFPPHGTSSLRVGSRSFMAWMLLFQGHPNEALHKSRQALAEARELNHPYTSAFAFHVNCLFSQVYGDRPAVEERAAALMVLAAEQGFPHLLGTGTFFHGWALAAKGSIEAGIDEMRRGLAAKEATGAEIKVPYYLGLLASAHAEAGQSAEALPLLAEALNRLERTGERWFEAELHRRKGEVLLSLPERDRDAAEACFRQAIAVAQGQQAKLWELRAMTSLARLWRHQGKRAEAHRLLAPVYGWFTEGFDTADLKDAKALLDALA